MGCSRSCKQKTLTISGILSAVIGSFMLGFFDQIFDVIFNKQMGLTPSSTSYGIWQAPPVPIYLEFSFWNWTNPVENPTPGYKPILQEIGPYVYREYREKVKMNWLEYNKTVTFYQNRTWVFEPSLSGGSLDDELTTINIPAISAAFTVRNSPGVIKAFLNLAMVLLGTKIYIKEKVRAFIFEGYSDPLLDIGSLVPEFILPEKIPFDKFGWFYTRNGSYTYDGRFNMYTGTDDISNIGVIGNWNYEKQTRYFESHCGLTNGSAGELFPPKATKTKISLFSSDICRSIDLVYKEETEVDGIRTYRFWGDENMFANYTKIPDNWCWCPSGICPPHGAVDVSSCKWGVPAYISLPHFFQADPYYTQSVAGMNPQEDKHKIFIDLEPRTGVPLQVSAAFQINMLMQPMPEYRLLKNLPVLYFPTMWFAEHAEVSEDLRFLLKLVLAVPTIATVIFSLMIAGGIFSLLFVFYCLQNEKNVDSGRKL